MEIAYEKWHDKNRDLPYITFGSYEVILEGEKSVNIDVNIMANDKQSRDKIAIDTYNFVKSLIPCNEIKSIDIQAPLLLDFGEKDGVFRKVVQAEFLVKYSLSKEEKKEKDLGKEKDKIAKICKDLTGFFATNFVVSPTKKYMLCYRFGHDEAYLIENERKELWHNKLGGINDVAISPKEDYVVFATYLTKKEMGGDFKIGGHAYCFDIKGNKLTDFKTEAVAESCAISFDGSFYTVGTVKPDNSVYCFDNSGKLLWKKKVGKVVTHLNVQDDGNIVVYTGVRHIDREEFCVLTSQGNIIK